MNIVQLYDYIGQIAQTIPIVHSYSNQTPYEYWNTHEVKYGSVIFAVKTVRTQNNIAKFDCVLYYGDRLNETGSNRDSVQSDAIGVLDSIVSRLNCSERVEYVTYPFQTTLFEQKFADNLAGAYTNITIDLPATGNCCDYNLLDDYYTKAQVDKKLENIEAGEVDLSNYYTKAQVDKKLSDIEEGDIDLTNYYTKQQIDSKGYLTSIPSQYVTEAELNAKGYLTSVPSQYVTENELAAKKYLTAIPSEYVTETELEQRLENVDVDLTGYATEAWVEGKGYLNTAEVDKKIQDAVTNGVDLDDYYTKQQIDNKGYLTSVPSEYVTEAELESKGYLTEVPSQYVTETELEDRLDELNLNVDLNDYYTKQQIDSKGFVTNATLVNKDYATRTELNEAVSNIDLEDYYTKGQSDSKYQPKGNYLTSIPAEYVTETELTGKNYATKTEVNSKQNQLVSGTNIKTINGESILGSGNIEIKGGSADLEGYATEQWVEDKGYLTSIPSEYITETELEARLENVEVDLTNYYTKDQVDAMVGAVNQILNSLINDIDTEALETQLNDILNKQ
jgi:hypothetical protein